MSKPFDTPFEEWSIVNYMLPTRYHPPFANNVYKRVTASIAAQLFPKLDMSKDYDQLLNRLKSGPDSPAARAAVGIEGGGARADDQRGRVEG